MNRSSKADKPNNHSSTSPPAGQTPLLRKVGPYVVIAFELPGIILGALLLGYFLDNYLDTTPWLTVIFTVLAFIKGLMRLIDWVNAQKSESIVVAHSSGVSPRANLHRDFRLTSRTLYTFHPSDRSTRVPTGSRTKVSAKRPSLGSSAVPPVAPAASAVCAAPLTSSTSMPKW